MEPHEQLAAMLDLAESVGIEVRRAPGGAGNLDTPGGAMVRLKGRQMLFLDPAASVADQISVVAEALAQRPELRDRYLPPEIRDRLDAAAQAQ